MMWAGEGKGLVKVSGEVVIWEEGGGGGGGDGGDDDGGVCGMDAAAEWRNAFFFLIPCSEIPNREKSTFDFERGSAGLRGLGR